MAKKSSEVAKRIQPKSIETKILNPQVLLNKTTVKTTQQNSSDEKVSQPHVTEKLSFEAKLPSGTICVGTKIDDNKSQQTEKGKQYNSQIFGENLSISISNVAQKKNNIEKPTISPPKSDRSPVPTNIGSLTITPVSNSVKDSHTKTSPITSPFSVNNANNELQISPNQMSPGTIKVKSVNALFDKETIAKIISSKNSDSNNKHLTQNRDPQRVKSVDLHKPSKGNHTDYNIKIDNHQSSRTSIISDPKISSSESPKTHSNSNDLFIKPKSIKNDHSSFSGRIHNNSEHHQDVHMRDSENYKSDSVRLNKKYPDSPSNNPYIKSPGGTPTSNSAYSSNNKSGSTENYSTEIARTLNLPNSARALNFAGHNLNRSKQRNASDSYDSGSDDCEIVSDDLTKPHTREEEGSVPESLQKQFEMQYRAIYSGSQLPDKRTPPKSSDFTIKNIVKETDHSVKHILHAAHQDIPVTSKSSESRLNSDEDNNHSDKMSYKIGTEERSHPVSVIKDNFVNKSDRNKELVPESETSNNDLSPMEVAIDQEMDFTRMMQGYKELEVCSS